MYVTNVHVPPAKKRKKRKKTIPKLIVKIGHFLTISPNFLRRYAALYVSRHIFARDGEIDEIVGHTYLFLKEQLENSTVPPLSGILHGTIIGMPSALNFIFVLSFLKC